VRVGLAITRRRFGAAGIARFRETLGYLAGVVLGQSLAPLYPSHQEFQRIGNIVAEKMRVTGVATGARCHGPDGLGNEEAITQRHMRATEHST
jgi:hypothetical protein